MKMKINESGAKQLEKTFKKDNFISLYCWIDFFYL